MSWSDDITLIFVKLFLKHECLWNPVHPRYKLLPARRKAYSDIASEFKSNTMISLTRVEVKSKVTKFRIKYRKEVDKIFRHSCPGFTYKSPLIWFNEMDRCYRSIPGQEDSVLYNSKVDSMRQMWTADDPQVNNLEEANSDPHNTIPQNNNEYDSVMQEEPTAQAESQQSPLQTPSDSSSESMSQENEFDIYGKLLAVQLRNISLEKGLRLQLELQNLISEAKLSDLLSQ